MQQVALLALHHLVVRGIALRHRVVPLVVLLGHARARQVEQGHRRRLAQLQCHVNLWVQQRGIRRRLAEAWKRLGPADEGRLGGSLRTRGSAERVQPALTRAAAR